MSLRWTVASLAFTAVAALGAESRVAIRVSPELSFAPANLKVRTMVATSRENRSVEVIAESAQFYRSSEIELDGERAPRMQIVEFRSLPSGIYDVRAILKGPGGHRLAVAERQINIIESGITDRYR
jgi:hypothetical protein